MKKMTKFTTLLMALVLAMGTMTGCGGNGGSSSTKAPETTPAATEASGATAENPIDVELTVWAPQEEQKGKFSKVDEKYGTNLLKYMCDTFNTNHPEWNITFKYAVCAEGDAKTELQKDASAAADVFMFAGDQTAELQQNGILYPLEGDAIETIKANNTEKSITAATFTDDELGGEFLYGVPFSPNSWFLFYDKGKFSEDEVKSLDTMMAKDLGDGVSNFSIPIDNGWYNAAFFLGAGCTLFGANGDDPAECSFNNETGLAVGQYMIDLATSSKFLFEDGTNIGISKFKEGKLGAWCGGTWNVNDVKEALGDNYGAAALPTFTIDGKECHLSSFADYKYIGVNANCKNPEVAQALAAWLGGEECQKDRYLARGTAPTWTTLAEDADIKADTAVAALSEQAQYATVQSSIAQMQNFWNPAKALGSGIYNKEITKDNLQEKLDEMVKNILTSVK